jgi:tRNA nucleotidyltransferase/poly(A) polymerase
MQIEIPQKFKEIIKKISQTAQENGFEAYIVGGFVRDLFLNRIPYDLDIMVEPKNQNEKDAGMRLAQIISKKYKTIEPVLFKRFGTAKLLIDGEDVEFVMPRKEYYSDDSRNPDTELGSIEQDALRRDFTINALFLRLSDMQVLDLTKKGLDDIKDKIIRVADPFAAEFIFAQDPLRILRGIRQSLQLGFDIEEKTFKAMRSTADRISIVSPERIKDEINKILVCPQAPQGFKLLDEISLLKIIFPELKRLQNLRQPPQYHQDDVYEHTMKVLDRTDNILELRMAALLHDVGKFNAFKEADGKITFYSHEDYSASIAQDILIRLKYSNDFLCKVVNIVKNHMRVYAYDDTWTDAAIRHLAISCEGELDLTISLAQADYGKDLSNPRLPSLQKRIKDLQSRQILYPKSDIINGQEIMEHFNIKQGILIGKIKTKIFEVSIENPTLTKQEALEIAADIIKSNS